MKKIIDLSEHNGIVDFAKVKETGIKDVILRLGWIGNHNNHTLDLRFNEYFKQAKLYGFNVGIYVMQYSKSVEAIKSAANWVISQLTNKTIELPIFLDVEDDPNSNSYLSKLGKNELTKIAKTFCNIITKNGYKAGVYANKNFFLNYLDHNSLLDYKIWWAEYNGKENPTNKLKVDLWQYTSKGKIKGIEGNVDISKCMCECKEAEKPKGSVDYNMKKYVNGSTNEIVYQDANCTKQIGYLNPRETATCYGLVNNKALIVYKMDGKDNYKTGFVKWLGGIKN